MFPTEFPFLFPEQGGNNRGWDISGPWLWGKVPVGRSVLGVLKGAGKQDFCWCHTRHKPDIKGTGPKK